MNAKSFALLFLGLCLCLVPLPAQAGNGHLLHGVGAVNSSLGGAGVALPSDAIGALLLNPALLAHLDGHRMQFSLEMLDVQNAVESSAGPFSGRTEDDADPANIPAFGWSHHRDGAKAAYGMGFLGLAGFGVDYPQDSSNPVLAPQPIGFGRFYSNYQLLQIPLAFAYQVSPNLTLGGALIAARATLSGEPVGFAAPDCSGPTTCFFPRVANDSAMGFGAQVGIHWQANDLFAVGASYTTETRFEDFEWNSSVANPNLPTFGTARKITFALDSPPILVAGVGITPSPRLSFALDGKWVGYEDTDGYGGVGVDPATGAVRGLGWEDMFVIAAGAQFRATDRVTLRGGYNRSDNPIPDERTFFSLAAPAVFEDHATLGLGLRLYESLTLDLAYYKAFENEGSGPILSPAGPVPGTRVTQENSIDSLIFTLSFNL